MAFTAQQTQTFEITEQGNFGTGGRTTLYRVNTLRVTGCDRHFGQVHTMSANLSAHEIPLDPLATDASVASGGALFLQADKPVDVRIGAASHTPLSNVQLLVAALTVSGLFITTGSQVTTIRTDVVGGSAATVTVSKPIA